MNKVVCAVGLIRQGETFLVRRRSHSPESTAYLGAYEAPGGKVNVGELVPDALVREVYDECGLTVTVAWLVDVYDAPQQDLGQTAVTFLYRVSAWHGNIHNEPGKAPWEWRSRSEITSVCPATPNALLYYLGANSALRPLISIRSINRL